MRMATAKAIEADTHVITMACHGTKREGVHNGKNKDHRDDGSIIVYVENADATKVVVGLMPKGSNEMKVWSGEATTAADGKETVTDEKTGETFSYTWTENAEDGTVSINTDKYGKGALTKMTVADWLALDELYTQMASR